KRELKGNKTLYSIDITDYSDSITVKLFCNKNRTSDIDKNIQLGTWIRVRGNCRFDTYQREEVLMANDIMLIKPDLREDKSEEKRVELHLHTQMSALDAVSPVSRLVERAAQWGHPAVAITDHGVIQAFPEAYEAGQKYGIKIIYGVEA